MALAWTLSLAFDEFSRVAFVVTSRLKTSCCRHVMNAATFLFLHTLPSLQLCPTRLWTLGPGFLLMQASVFVQSLAQTQANCMAAKRTRGRRGRGRERERLPLKVGYINSIGLVSDRRRVAAFRLHCVLMNACMHVCMYVCAHICIARGVAQTALFNNNEPHKHTHTYTHTQLEPKPGALSMLHLQCAAKLLSLPRSVAIVGAAQVEANLHQTTNSGRIGHGTCDTECPSGETNLSIQYTGHSCL